MNDNVAAGSFNNLAIERPADGKLRLNDIQHNAGESVGQVGGDDHVRPVRVTTPAIDACSSKHSVAKGQMVRARRGAMRQYVPAALQRLVVSWPVAADVKLSWPVAFRLVIRCPASWQVAWRMIE